MMARLPRIPDLLTTANLACGVGSILLASQGQLTWACWLVFVGALFDVLRWAGGPGTGWRLTLGSPAGQSGGHGDLRGGAGDDRLSMLAAISCMAMAR